ncbi:diguanylate cyclase [Chromobacterium amazonense]|uniref:putative bifunctional diguanylate cyclase/phosphodiesterase n=1 Tax=Chromobacterium amazonense TaxID=1382803 RepID=UPI0008DA4BB1|nr:EAL domain-containing protein [Chromobacterium amazonense]OHX16092.1 diguanylate cyclase [Chromobacterium amazonense]
MAQQADDKTTASTGLNLRDVFLIAVILGLLIPASIISYLSFNIQKDNLTAQLDTDQRRLLDIVALGMQEPLWNLSRQAGNPLIASVMEDPRVISIRVTDTQSNQVFLSAVHSERRIGSVSYVEKPVIYRGEAIGQVTMEFDNENLAIALSNQVKNILTILAAQLVLSIMLIMSILHSRFLRPMRLAAKVFENTVEGIMITDADKRIRSVNRAFTEITGYTQHEVLGQKTSILSSGRHDEPFYEQMWQSISEQGSWQGELWNRRKNGEVYPEWLAINAVRNSLGEITHYVAIFSDLTERKAADDRIQFLAHFDVLTSLPNRVHMQDRVELAIHNAVRDNQRLALLLLDLDRFKTVNESLGHSAGDTLLQVAADRIRSVLAPGEMLARQGGDEFIILLPLISDPGEAALAAERVREVFASPIELHNHVITITPSIGISVYPDDGRDYETLVRNADAAMYHAKSSGRNSYKFYTADLNARAREILAIESQLRFALERDEFVLHYQPQVDMKTGCIIGAEALIRWNHPSLGLLGPVRFIQVAEERGFIVQIGNWVIAEATRQMVAWRQAGLPEVTLAINLSALQFRQPDLAEQVQQALLSHDLPGHALDIEVTESVIMEDAQATIQAIDTMKSMGLRLSIDDFGTGYSSLSYLKRFKADKLKIDRSFVRDIPQDADDSAIARAIINMAKNLNMQVVAEGVETMEQWQFLEQEGCDFVQGYLIAKPLPAEEFAALLTQGSLLPQDG